jgi:predicted MFS family arabinose efflux permease
MSIGILLAQVGFALGATIGGLAITYLGITTIPLVAVIFVLGAVALALSLRSTVRRAARERELEGRQSAESSAA